MVRWDGSVERSGGGEKERGKREGGENGGEVYDVGHSHEILLIPTSFGLCYEIST